MKETLLHNDSAVRHNEVARLCPTPENSLCFQNASDLTKTARELLKDRPGELVLELDKVDLIDSSGLRALLDVRKACEAAGTAFRLGSLSGCVERIIAMSKLNSLFGLPDLSWDKKPAGPAVELDLGHSGWKISEFRAVSDPAVISSLRERAMEAAIEAIRSSS